MPRLALAGAAFGLFLVWSNSFVAIGYLLGADGAPASFDWVGLTVARFLPIAPLCALYCFFFERRASIDALRRHGPRLAVGGLLAVPGYNFALYFGQQRGVPAPIASLTTALLPLMVLVLAAIFLGERMTRRRLAGLGVALAGMILIAAAKRDAGGASAYGAVVAVTALAPLSWSLFSILSKPLAGRVPPLVWTYLAITLGSLPLVAIAPFRGGPELFALDAAGAAALAYLSLPCTVLGFAVWTWLLKHLPASSVGFTVFLNPPLTTASKAALAALFPATFLFTITPREWLGGALALAGLAIAVAGQRRPRMPGPPDSPPCGAGDESAIGGTVPAPADGQGRGPMAAAGGGRPPGAAASQRTSAIAPMRRSENSPSRRAGARVRARPWAGPAAAWPIALATLGMVLALASATGARVQGEGPAAVSPIGAASPLSSEPQGDPGATEPADDPADGPTPDPGAGTAAEPSGDPAADRAAAGDEAAAAPDEDAAPLTEEERIARLAPDLQQWLIEVEILIAEEERDYFLGLEEEFRRRAFVEEFWRVRDPDRKTGYNELRRKWRARIDTALSAFGSTRDDRAKMLLLNGEPTGITFADGRVYTRCWSKDTELEVWFYYGSERTKNPFFAVFFLPQFNTRGLYRIWIGDEVMRPRRRFGLPSTNPSDFCPEDVLATVLAVVERDSFYLQEMRRLLEPPEPPSKEWVATFASRSATLPEGVETFEVTAEFDFPGRNQNRTAVRGAIAIAPDQARPAEVAGRTVYRFLLTGEVVRNDQLLESFLYRFEVPPAVEAGGKVPLVFQRYLRAGDAELRLKIEDLEGGAFAYLEERLDVPSPTGLRSMRARPEGGLFELYAEAEAAAARGQAMIRLLPPPEGQVHVGGMRFRTLTAGEFDHVTFYLNDEPVLTKRRPPFSVELNLGGVARTHRLRVVAYDAEGGEAASDELVVNRGGQRFRLRLSEPRPDKTYDTSLAAVVQLEVPEDKALERVEIYLDDRLVATLYQEPFVQPMLLEGEGIAIVRAVAYLEDGLSTEDVVIVNAPDYFERVEVNYVELYASVLDASDRPLLGLERDDFEVREDGMLQQIRRFEFVRDLPFHAGLLIDTSASMEESLAAVRQAARVFAEEAIRPKDRLALFSFSLRPVVEVPFTGEPAEVAGKLDGLRATGTTALYDSLVFSLHYFDGIRGQKALLLLSDGEDEASVFDYEAALETARRAGVTIYVIGLKEAAKSKAARKVLAAFAEETGGRAFFLEGLDELEGVYRSIQEELRSQYLMTYQSTSEKDASEFRRIEVEIVDRKAEVRTLSGYYP